MSSLRLAAWSLELGAYTLLEIFHSCARTQGLGPCGRV